MFHEQIAAIFISEPYVGAFPKEVEKISRLVLGYGEI